VTCGSSGYQAARAFVDQAAQDGFSEDPFVVEVSSGEVFTVGDALGDALVRPGRVQCTWYSGVSCSNTRSGR
jgi:hypothetical protein